MRKAGIRPISYDIFKHQQDYHNSKVGRNGCVLACIEMVLKYYKIEYNEKNVFDDLNKGHQGVLLNDASEFLIKYSEGKISTDIQHCPDSDFATMRDFEFMTQPVVKKILEGLLGNNLLIIGLWDFETDTKKPLKHAVVLTKIDFKVDLEGNIFIHKAYILDPNGWIPNVFPQTVMRTHNYEVNRKELQQKFKFMVSINKS